MPTNAKALILCAGKGARMGELGSKRPKCLLEIGGQIILDRHIVMLQKHAVTDICVVTGHLSHDIEAWLCKYHPEVSSKFNPSYHLDSLRSLMVGLRTVRGEKDILIISGDRVFSEQIYLYMTDCSEITCLVLGPEAVTRKRPDSLTIHEGTIVGAEKESVYVYGGITYVPHTMGASVFKHAEKVVQTTTSPWYFSIITSLLQSGITIFPKIFPQSQALNINKPSDLQLLIPE